MCVAFVGMDAEEADTEEGSKQEEAAMMRVRMTHMTWWIDYA